MYTTHFGFESKPFKPKDFDDFYRNTSFDAACADILDGIRERRGFVLLTGEVGLGKTQILRRCMAEADDIRFVLLANTGLDFPDILNYLCASLGLLAESQDSEQQSRLLLEALAANARRNQITALLIDDAHLLRISVLRQLLEFVEKPQFPNHRLQVVLVGLPEIEGKLRQPELLRLQASIRMQCRLERLSRLETALFVAHQFRVAGQDADELVSPAVLERIASYCHGVPRAIATLCDAVLMLGSLDSKRDITLERVDEAARNCFLVEQNWPSAEAGAPGGGHDPGANHIPVAATGHGHDFALNWSELGFSLDLDLEKPLEDESATPSAAKVTAPLELEPTVALPPVHTPPSTAQSPPSVLATMKEAWPSLGEFVQLLEDIAAKQKHWWDARDRAILHRMQAWHLRLLQDVDAQWLANYEQRVARLVASQQPMWVSLAVVAQAVPERDGVFGALLLNPTWWLYREIRLRLRSPDLSFAHDGQFAPLRLLDGRDAQPSYVSYRHAGADPVQQTTLWLELDLLDHRGEWHAYNNRLDLHLNWTGQGEDKPAELAAAGWACDSFWPTPEGQGEPGAGSGALEAETGAGRASILACTPLLELVADRERTSSLSGAGDQVLSRGTPLTRAVLLTADSAHAPTRIEIVSRPFMIFGRHGAAADTSFGDFTLGFVPRYNRISRLHCVICALGDQLTLMPASDQGDTYTGRNEKRLVRGQWEFLQNGDILDICDLYQLRLTLAWERGKEGLTSWDPQEPRNRFGHYLLSLVDVLKQRDQQTGTDELRATLRNRYLNMLRMQDRVAELNGVGNPGSLLYARFDRVDAASRRIVHYYVPKWLPIGNSLETGLCINAEGVAPRQAELLFRGGMYWVQNLAEPGSVRIGCHGLATNEVLALEAGDELMIGTARFVFEAY